MAQLVPLRPSVIERINPETHAFLMSSNVQYASGLLTRHPLSVVPAATWKGAAFIASFALLLFGSMRALRRVGTRSFCLGLIALGTILALVGIIQKPLYTGRIYGFWEPEFRGSPFGPFVNKNHFAGWMIMALSLSLGYYCGAIASLARGTKTALRDRVLWLSSAEANQLVLIGVCLALMALSLVLTLSRSGISCLALAVLVTGSVAILRRRERSRTPVIAGYLVLLLVVAVGWTGSEVVAQRFASADWSEFNNRLGAWGDARRIAGRFMPVGSGLNTYGKTTIFFQSIDPKQHYAEAHNDYLQLAAEGGLLVGVPALLTLAAFAWLVWKRFRRSTDDVMTWWVRVGAVTGLLAMALQEVVEFSLQMPANAALVTVLMAVAAHDGKSAAHPSRRGSRGARERRRGGA
jgi:O-antigen ligase